MIYTGRNVIGLRGRRVLCDEKLKSSRNKIWILSSRVEVTSKFVRPLERRKMFFSTRQCATRNPSPSRHVDSTSTNSKSARVNLCRGGWGKRGVNCDETIYTPTENSFKYFNSVNLNAHREVVCNFKCNTCLKLRVTRLAPGLTLSLITFRIALPKWPQEHEAGCTINHLNPLKQLRKTTKEISRSKMPQSNTLTLLRVIL